MNPIFYPVRVTLILLAMTFLTSCQDNGDHRQKTATSHPPAKVSLYTVTKISVADQVEIMGTIQAAQKAVISSRISGNIIDIDVIPGSQVQKGDFLVEINAGEISARLLQAKAELDQANRNLKREQKLLSQKAATPEAVKALDDVHKIALAGFKEAQIMLSYTTITAPFDGLITKKLADVGELATPGSPLLHLADEENLQVQADIPETIAQNIQLGMDMQVSVPSAAISVRGTVSEIAPASDPLTRTVPFKLDIDKTPQLRSGQFARISLPGNRVETLIVPKESIVSIGQLERVFILADGKARLRLIRSGKSYPQGIEILSGLNPGDKLITRGADQIHDGQTLILQ